MGSYNTAVITTVGQALLTSVIGAQGTMTFTKLQTSSYGYASGTDLSALTSLNNVEQEESVTAGVIDSTHIYANALISNTGVSTEYNANTLGIFASDGVNEVLFAVSTAVTPDVIPVDLGGTPSTYKYKFTLAVSSTSDITITSTSDIDATDVSYDNTASGLNATNVQTAIDEVNSSIGSIVTDLRTRSKRLYEGFLNTNQSANVTIPSGGNYLVVAGDLNGTDYKMNAWLVSVIGTPSNGRHTIFKFVNEAQKATISFSSNTTLVLSTTDANGTEFTVTQL